MSVRAMKWAYDVFDAIDLPPAERLVLLALCWDHTDNGGCYPTQERIAKMSGYRRRKVVDCMSNLEGLGLITRKTQRSGGKFQKTEYTLFGVVKRPPCADGGTRHRAHKKAHGEAPHRAQTGAQNRGTITIRDNSGFDVVEFPAKTAGGF